MATFVIDAEYSEGNRGLLNVKCLVIFSVDKNQYEFFTPDNYSSLKSHEAFKPGNQLVAYYALAEIRALSSLGIKIKSDIVDLFLIVKTDFKKSVFEKLSLISVCDYFGIKHIAEKDKNEMRALALKNDNYSKEEINNLLEYCKSDVSITTQLYEKLKEHITPQLIIWGEYLKICQKIEARGIPVNNTELEHLLTYRNQIKGEIINNDPLASEIYEDGAFSYKNFETYLKKNKIAWFFNQSGKLELSESNFDKVKNEYPKIYQLGRTRKYLSSLRSTKLEIEADGRVYSGVNPFGSLTGRNQPPGSTHILLHPSFFRGFVSPKKDSALIYLDYTQQEFGIAAQLSNDKNMIEAYLSGDPYLFFAKKVGAAPLDATKKTHPETRNIYKQAILAVQYGMGSLALANQIGDTEILAKKLLKDHRTAFPTFWNWIENYIDQSNLRGYCRTKWGWKLTLDSTTKTKTIANFPMQAGGSDILRQALFLLEENNIKTLAPLHDAVLIECQESDVDKVEKLAKKLLIQASKDYLDELSLGVESQIIHYGEHFPVEKSKTTWETIQRFIKRGLS